MGPTSCTSGFFVDLLSCLESKFNGLNNCQKLVAAISAPVPLIALNLLWGKTFLLITWSITATMLGESGLVRSTGMSRGLPLYARQCGGDKNQVRDTSMPVSRYRQCEIVANSTCLVDSPFWLVGHQQRTATVS
jgi:hypothetical protein